MSNVFVDPTARVTVRHGVLLAVHLKSTGDRLKSEIVTTQAQAAVSAAQPAPEDGGREHG